MTIWIFGYGSLMTTGWEDPLGCIQRVAADLSGYRRSFNKASVKNWGTKEHPAPTLNLLEEQESTCRGIAFEFPDEREASLRAHLSEREGKAFPLREHEVQLVTGDRVKALIPMYEGGNLVQAKDILEVAKMVRCATGSLGSCLEYVEGVAKTLDEQGIDDPAVNELVDALGLRRARSNVDRLLSHLPGNSLASRLVNAHEAGKDGNAEAEVKAVIASRLAAVRKNLDDCKA